MIILNGKTCSHKEHVFLTFYIMISMRCQNINISKKCLYFYDTTYFALTKLLPQNILT